MLKPTEYRKYDRRARPGVTERHGRSLIRATSSPAIRPRQTASSVLGRRAVEGERGNLFAGARLRTADRAQRPLPGVGPRGPLRRVVRPRLLLVASNPGVVSERSGAGLRLVAPRLGRALARQAQGPKRSHHDAVAARRTSEYLFVLSLAVTGILALVTSLRQLLGG
jgi:hypothetical protein